MHVPAPQQASEPGFAEKATSSGDAPWKVGSLRYSTRSLAILFGWLLWGDFAWSVRDRVIPPVMQIIFKKYECSDTLAALLFISFPTALGLLTGPFISYLSDRHRGRWGRRIPFLFFSTPFIVVSIVGLAFSPLIGKVLHQVLGAYSPGLNPMVLLFMGFFCLGFEFFCGIANMIFGGLVNDVVPPTVVGRFYALFRAISLLVGIVLGYSLLQKAETHYTWIFLGIGVLYGLGFSMMCLKVKEGDYPDPLPLPPKTRPLERFLQAAKSYIKDGYGHSYYLWYFAATILATLSITASNLYTVFYAKSIDLNMETYFKSLSISFVFSLALAYPLGWLSDRYHPLRMMIITTALHALCMLYTCLFARDASTYALALVANAIVAGSFYTVSSSISQRILPRNKYSQMGSAGGTIGCLIGIVFAPSLGLFLDHNYHAYAYAFYISFVIATMAFFALLILHRQFMALGGPDHYVAPFGD